MTTDWLRQFLPYEQGIPVDDTIAWVMRKLDTKMFKTCFAKWIKSVSQAPDGDVVAIDGKQLRRSDNGHASTPSIQTVSAWSCANNIVLGQVKTAGKSNDIMAILQLLDVLTLIACVVTIDTMGCQKFILRTRSRSLQIFHIPNTCVCKA
jgi:DDE_Tnp_1-associated